MGFTRPLVAGCLAGLVAVAVGAFRPAPASAQDAPRQMPMYDLKTETTLKGIVDEVKTAAGRMGGRSLQGTHIMLRTTTETIEVHLGPSDFLKEKKVEIAKDDTVEVVGSRVKIGEAEVILAREIRKGETSWTLRDANGRPLWRMGRR